jgi:hypothetical protein
MRPLLLAALIPWANLAASAVVEAFGELPATVRDQHGDTVGGIGSGIVYDAKNDVYLMLSDRGPGDGTLPYRPRLAVVKIAQEGDKLIPTLVETVIFKDENGVAMTGLIPDDPDAELPKMKDGRTCLDPEALALAKDGRLFVTDEYGPFLYEFRRDGTMVRRITLPAEFHPREASGKLNYTDKAQLVSGRAINQGPEGMCILPGETQAALIFQSASVQDGGKPAGATKILILDLATGHPVALYRYELSPTEAGKEADKLSVNDLVALDDRRFLVLERDGQGRDGAKNPELATYKSVWLADARNATNLLVGDTETPPVSVAKQMLFNLSQLVKDQQNLAAKWEGIVVVPPSSEEELTLIMTADNDFLAPLIHENGESYPFPRTEDAVPTQFFKIRTPLPKNP